MRHLAIAALCAGCGARTHAAAGDATTACSTDGDCGGTTPYCDPEAHACVECRFDSECTGAEKICEGEQCRAAQSCKQLVTALPGLPSGLYTLDFDGAGPAPELQAWCDMTTSGGGWMALLQPDMPGLAPLLAGVTAMTTVVSGTQTCSPDTVPQPITANGWNGVRSYACGTVTFTLAVTWPNAIGATDVMIAATLQGQDTHALAIGGTPIAAAAASTDPGGASCEFYNSTAAAPVPGENACYQTVANAPPQVATGALTGDLALAITTGAACDPDCSHGTGMTLAQLFVR